MKSLFCGALALSILSGCATIMGNPTQTIPIGSTPSEAKIVISDESGAEVFAGSTPTSVTLNKSTGRYWGKKSFQVTISKPGYKTQVIPITASTNGWYIGNILFGGLIGWFAVDPFNGNMYTLSPETIAAGLSTESGHNNRSSNGSIAILLLQDVPANLRDKMIKIN